MAMLSTPSEIEFLGYVLNFGGINVPKNRAVRARALIDGQSQITRHERCWWICKHLIGRHANVAPEFDDISESCGAKESRLCSFPLDDGVGNECRRMGKSRRSGRRAGRGITQLGQASEHSPGRIIRRRQSLCSANVAGSRLVEDEVRKGPADVAADPKAARRGCNGAHARTPSTEQAHKVRCRGKWSGSRWSTCASTVSMFAAAARLSSVRAANLGS